MTIVYIDQYFGVYIGHYALYCIYLYPGWAIDQCHHEARKLPDRLGKWKNLFARRLSSVARFCIAQGRHVAGLGVACW